MFGGLFAKNVVNSAEFAEKEAPAVLLFKRYQIKIQQFWISNDLNKNIYFLKDRIHLTFLAYISCM